MRLLLVKTSSLGDVIHALPALTDAAAAMPGLRCDWVVEEAFAAIPGWHPAVERIIPVALRRWRRNWRKSFRSGEIRTFLHDLRSRPYDRIIDAQGLLKSALPTLLARGPGAGYGCRSAREAAAGLLYRRRHSVPRELHAVERIRRLFAAELDYPLPDGEPDYGIRPIGRPVDSDHPYLLFLHATTWPSKHWPLLYWAELADLAAAQGYRVLLPWYAPEERLRAERIIQAAQTGELLPREELEGVAQWIGSAAGVVGVDTGLAHLAAALGTPALTLYGPTRIDLTGAVGPRQRNLAVEFPCAPCLSRECSFRFEGEVESEIRPACFTTLPPELVWEALSDQMVLR